MLASGKLHAWENESKEANNIFLELWLSQGGKGDVIGEDYVVGFPHPCPQDPQTTLWELLLWDRHLKVLILEFVHHSASLENAQHFLEWLYQFTLPPMVYPFFIHSGFPNPSYVPISLPVFSLFATSYFVEPLKLKFLRAWSWVLFLSLCSVQDWLLSWFLMLSLYCQLSFISETILLLCTLYTTICRTSSFGYLKGKGM